ncbi:MAG: phosphoribosylformylglycinamidine synthase subunit PurS [Thermoproteus sp.]
MYAVYLNITYKPSIREPEGETISKELLQRFGFKVEVRAGKCLMLLVDAPTPQAAAEEALRIAREARLGNPNVHAIEVVKVVET